MADFTGTSPAATYKNILQIPNSNAGLDSTLRTIQGGGGNNGTIQLSTTGFNILATATWTAAADLAFTQANPNLFGGDTDGVFSISGGATAILGSNVKMYGDTHATQADDFEVFGSATLQLRYDDSGSLWDFQANAITTSGLGTFTGGIISGGNIVSDADSTDDLGTTGTRWRNLFVDDVTITSTVSAGGTLAVTGVATFGDDVVSDTDSTDDLGTTGVRWANLFVDGITLTTTITAGTSGIFGDMTVSNGSIVSSSGAISFGNENLSTTGTAATGALTVTGAGTVTGDITQNDASATGSPRILIKQDGTERARMQYLDSGDDWKFNNLGGPITLFASGTLALTCTNADVAIAGALSKGSGTFHIEHPLAALSETHNLVHSFIEGPQADLIYRGRVKLVKGKAKINIDTASGMTDGTFDVLCRDVQCFTTNETAWCPIRGSVLGNILTIEAEDATCSDTISWMVIGERKDAHIMETSWTDDNGKPVLEPLKPVVEEE